MLTLQYVIVTCEVEVKPVSHGQCQELYSGTGLESRVFVSTTIGLFE